MTRPAVLDVFAGVGGLALGFEQAGFDVVGALEIDPIHAATHSFNFLQSRTLCDDATALRGQDIRKKLQVPVDVVVGGASCQGFSMIGQRALEDPRNQLVKHFLRLVVELEPAVFVLENVRGLTVGKHRQLLDEATEEFQSAGYSVALPWQVLNARDHGVPQDRQRLFLMGAKGVEAPRYPDPDTVSPSPTCRDALDDVPDAEGFEELADSDSVRVPIQAMSSSSAMRTVCPKQDRKKSPRSLRKSLSTRKFRGAGQVEGGRRVLAGLRRAQRQENGPCGDRGSRAPGVRAKGGDGVESGLREIWK